MADVSSGPIMLSALAFFKAQSASSLRGDTVGDSMGMMGLDGCCCDFGAWMIVSASFFFSSDLSLFFIRSCFGIVKILLIWMQDDLKIGLN